MRQMYSVRLAGCLALVGSALLPRAASSAAAVAHESWQPSLETVGRGQQQQQQQQRLAVVVPAYQGDLKRAVSSLGRWPSACSPLTERNVDLVLYYAEGEEDSSAVAAAADAIAASAGRCFSNTKTVFAHLEEEEDAYPKGPSVMFYKMFLDEGVRSELTDYDALAIVEWDVLVATDNSFEELYHAAFRGNEDFWVKGSNLEGTNFHSSATVSEMWHVLGHINGNAIYNNNDPAFVEYVDYTRTRWSYTYPYDVALWLTISDFPYSWPLYQRYSNKFVTTNLIAYVGHDHVDHTTVSDAIAGKTLFIHGSSVDEGSIASIKATKSSGEKKVKSSEKKKKKHKITKTSRTRRLRRQRKLQKWRDDEKWKTVAKWQGDADNDAEPRWKRESKWQGNNDDSSEEADLPKWKEDKKWESNVCDDGCESDDGDMGRVCDTTCSDGEPYGKLGCSALDSLYGNYCRVCYNDMDMAHENDTEDDRAIMCDTLEPASVYRRLNAADKESAPRVVRKLQKWRDDEKWKTVAKWQGDADNDAEPRWKRESKWQGNKDDTDDSSEEADLPKWKEDKKWESNVCDDGCESNDGDMGRVCDTTCNDGEPYGKLGCSALDSLYGNYCRVCYNDIELARENDTEDDRAIMCDTVEPAEIYNRRLNAVNKESAPRVVRKLQKWREHEHWKMVAKWRGDADNDAEPRWKRESKWQGNNDDTDDSSEEDDLPKWKEDKKWESNVCDDGCESNDGDMGRVCDTTCNDGEPYGKLGCSALDSLYGNYCRVCYNDIELARENDTEDDRAIMCDTVKPAEIYSRRLNAVDKESAPRVARKLQKWRENEHWKTVAKWQGDADNDAEPRWKRESKWQGNNDDTDDSSEEADLPKWKEDKKWESNVCDDGCESNDGDMGRVCDTTCNDGEPYGKLGCSALDSLYGNYCRVCYNDIELARQNDTEDDRAIMCDTVEPAEIYSRRLNAVDKESAPRVARKLQKWREHEHWRMVAKWRGDADNDAEPRWKRESKWQGNNDDTDDSSEEADLPKWKEDKKWESNVCDDGCESNDGDMGRVCDTTCNDGEPYGKLGCSALDSLYGNYCRVCYNDIELARQNDTEDDRAIMCDTVEPAEIYSRRLNAVDKESAPRAARKLQKWREHEHWRMVAKWRGDADNDVEPRWKRESKWQGNNDDTDDSSEEADLPKWKEDKKWESNVCDDGCESDDGDMGRVCDTTCSDGEPYGKLGCSALDSLYGNYCRVCYNDVEMARQNDTEDDRAIMCDTVEPAALYTRRRLTAADTGVAAAPSVGGENAPAFFSEAAQRPYTDELVRDNLCAFVSGRAAEVDQVEVTVMSILQFVPGMRVAIATEADGVDVFERAVGDLPGVTVSSTANVLTASLFADEHCGAATSLIFYVRAGSVVSRAFTAKDTHSPHGELLVVYTKDRTIRDERFAKQTTVLLGFEAPSFTHGTDLILPVRANADLRNSLAVGSKKKGGQQQGLVSDKALSKLKDLSDVPQMLAALQYSRNTPGVWFFNPQTWVSHNLFKTASIWEIPLVKPRFTCEVYPSTKVETAAVAGILQRNLDFFAMGGTCEDGLIVQAP